MSTKEKFHMQRWMSQVEDSVNSASHGLLERKIIKSSIYKVPPHVLDLDQKSYIPRLVSFGPYHHHNQNLKSMEVPKNDALVHFLRRSNYQTLDRIYQSLLECVEDLKDSYDSLLPEWREDTDRFLHLMILDGCFMLEILKAHTKENDYPVNDPVFGINRMIDVMSFIKTDMLMIENQLPMLVLTKIAKEVGENENKVQELILKKLYNLVCINEEYYKSLHVLDMYRKCLIQQPAGGGGGSKDMTTITSINKPENSYNNRSSSIGMKIKCCLKKDLEKSSNMIMIRCARELKEAGIQFKKSKTKSLTDISFKKNTMFLPVFEVDDSTKSTFLNLMAFERCHVDAGHEVTNFICLLDSLIDRDMDIHILSNSKIINNFLGSDKLAAELFNTIAKDMTMQGPLKRVQKEIQNYCSKSYNRHRADLLHTYFQNPWTIVSLVAALFIFAITILQTVYTIKQFYQR